MNATGLKIKLKDNIEKHIPFEDSASGFTEEQVAKLNSMPNVTSFMKNVCETGTDKEAVKSSLDIISYTIDPNGLKPHMTITAPEGSIITVKNKDIIIEDSRKKILNTISYSVFDNYNVNMVVFEIEDKKYQYIYKNKKTIKLWNLLKKACVKW